MSMYNLFRQNKKGNISLTSDAVISITVFIFLVFAALYAISTLNPSSFFTSGGADANATRDLQQNLTGGVSQFGGYLPTAFKILAVVFILGLILFLFVYIRRMKDVSGSGGSSAVGL